MSNISNINWKPNKTQPLLILGHQRTGGTWFQKSLASDYYYLGEYFFPWHKISEKNPFGEFGINFESLKNPLYESENDYSNFIDERIYFLKNSVIKNFKLHSIRIHVTTHIQWLKDEIIEYLNENYQRVLYKRRDDAASFWSYIISEQFMSFNSNTDKLKIQTDIIVKEDIYKRIAERFKIKDIKYDLASKLFKTNDVIYYEDVLNEKPTWMKSNSDFVDLEVQNNKKKIIINNLDEVLSWASKDFDEKFTEKLLLSIKLA